MNHYKFMIISVLLIFSLPFTYGGCVMVFSSGDLDRPEDDGQPPGAIIGITSQAAIKSENAVQLTAGALAGGLMADDSQRPAFHQDDRNFQIDAFRILQFPHMLADSLRRIELSPALIFFNRGDLIHENGRFESSCGGSVSYTLQLNRETEIFSGRLAFEKYCANGITMTGKAEVDGSFQPVSGNFVSATFNFENLSDGAGSVDGEISMDFADSPILVTFDAYSTDERSGRVYWIKDYSLNLFEFAGHVEIEIFGTFYHPDYGFVSLTTSDPFIIHNNDTWPSAGQAVIYGAHNTSAQLMTIDHLIYGIEADSAGDGIFDWDSGILNCDDASSG